jgi:ribosomal protein S18 acetylase RimI-like enzyme
MQNELLERDATFKIIRPATEQDISVLVGIHKSAYTGNHFTTVLPDRTLISYYRMFFGGGSQIIVVATQGNHGNEEIQGFIVYGKNIAERISQFKRDAIGGILIAMFLNPRAALLKIFSSVYNKIKRASITKPAEYLLLSIAVRKSGCGIGSTLIESMLSDAKMSGAKTVGLYVNTNNSHALNLYFKHGFRAIENFGGQYYMEKILS